MDALAARQCCRVTEVIRIHKPGDLTCKVEQWKGISQLPLRVQVRGLAIDQPADPNIQAWIKNRIAKAQSIRLTNIEPRIYFRVTADLELDGKNWVETLKQHYSNLFSVEKSAIPEEEPHGSENLYLPAERDKSADEVRPAPRPFSFEDIMKMQVDLSSLDAQSTLREALNLIRDSFNPPLPLVVVWNDLQQKLYIDPETPIGLDGLEKISVKLALELILSAVGGNSGKPVVIQQDNLMLVVSSQFAASRKTTGVYMTGELTNPPMNADEYGRNTGSVGRGGRQQ